MAIIMAALLCSQTIVFLVQNNIGKECPLSTAECCPVKNVFVEGLFGSSCVENKNKHEH